MPTSTSQFSLPFLVRFTSVAGASPAARRCARWVLEVGQLDVRAAFTSSAVRLRMNTGLPRHDTVMAWPCLDRREIDLDGGQRLRGGVGVHLVDERPQRHGRADAGEGLRRDDDEVAPVGLFRGVRRQVSLPLHAFVRRLLRTQILLRRPRHGAARTERRGTTSVCQGPVHACAGPASGSARLSMMAPGPQQDGLTRDLFALF